MTFKRLIGTSKNVIPTKVGIQNSLKKLDSGFRRNDKHGVFRGTLIIIAVFFFAMFIMVPGFASAEGEEAPTPADDPVAELKPPPSYKVRKVLFFPLEIPMFAIRCVTFPIGETLKFLEEKHAIQKTLDFLSNKDKTLWVYPIIEGGAGNGFGGGVGVRDTDFMGRGYLFAASYKNHINLNQQASVSFGKLAAFEIYNRPLSYTTGLDWMRLLSESYYGEGNDSSVADQGSYSLNRIEVGATFTYSFSDDFNLGFHLEYDSDHSFTTKEGGIPIQNIFQPSMINAFGRWLDYLDMGLLFSHDTRDSIISTQSGGYRTFAYHRNQCLNNFLYSYDSFNLDIRQYFKMWHPRQVLILRMNWVFLEAIGDDKIPFWRLASLDANNFLRGFPVGRFRDRNSLLFNVEYRFPLWDYIDGVMFYDTGRVFHSITNVSLNNIKYSVGGGIDLWVPKLALFHFQVGYGGEGVNIMFGTSQQL